MKNLQTMTFCLEMLLVKCFSLCYKLKFKIIFNKEYLVLLFDYIISFIQVIKTFGICFKIFDHLAYLISIFDHLILTT